MSYLRGNPNAGQHPAEVIVSVLEQDNMGNPILWVGGDNRVYGFDERGQLADFTDWYAAQQNQYAHTANRGFQTPGFGQQNFGFGYNQSGYEPSPATSPRGFSRNRNTANTNFGYDDYDRTSTMGSTSNSSTMGRNTIGNTMGHTNAKNIPTDTNKATRFNRDKRDVVVDDFAPFSGSEMIPLYDEDRENLEVDFDYDNKYFKLTVK